MNVSKVAFAASLVTAIAITMFGYMYLVGAHPSSLLELSLTVKVAIPFAVLGPDFPTTAQFAGIVFANVLSWFVVTFGLIFVVIRLGCAT